MNLRPLSLAASALALGLLACGGTATDGTTSSSGNGGTGGGGTTTGNQVSITTDATYRYVASNGIADHATGTFPNANNPNAISAQNYHFRMLLAPTANAAATYFGTAPAGTHKFGVAVNGVPFDPFTAEWYNRNSASGWHIEAMGTVNLGLDSNNAHVQPNGAYHYHGLPMGMLTDLSADRHSKLVGWAADGFPVYALYGYTDPASSTSAIKKLKSGWRLKTGTRPSGPGGTYDGTYVEDYEYAEGLGDLDEANGRFTVTPEFPSGTYAYFLTDTFPVIPHHFRANPDGTFALGAQ